MKTKTTLPKLVFLAVAALALCLPVQAKLTAPKPTASQGKYASYVLVKWAKVSGATRGYVVYRGTSTSWSKASSLSIVKSTSYKDTSAKSGKTYYYWVLPVDKKNTAWYNPSRYAKGYLKKTSSSSGIVGNSSVKLGFLNSITLKFKYNNSYRTPERWYKSNNNVQWKNDYFGYYQYGSSVQVYGWSPGSTTVYAVYNGKTYSKKITVASVAGGNSISGAASLKAGESANYYLYLNGKKVTDSAVAWSRSGLATMSDKGYYGLLKATNRPVTTNKVTVIAQYKGKKYTKTVTITR